MRILFEHNGYRVSAASSVAEAVQIGIRDTPQIVLLDLSLGHGEDGLEVLDQWRDRGVRPRAILALTGHADEKTRYRCEAAGCAAVLLKPVPSAELVKAVRALT
jgi:two-component system response regulator NreC